MEPISSGKIKFQVETKRILEILSSEIYDSPYALLRENIQNAYDAILMRSSLEHNFNLNEGLVEIVINEKYITIKDNGLGMNEEVLRNNFWKAGSSGKKTDLAKRAGVIGTFGIGAMANFGVCTSLRVETREVGSETTLISFVEKDNVSLSEECIEFEVINDKRQFGTTIIATLSESYKMEVPKIINYLDQYIKYVPVRITINGEVVSQKDYKSEYLRDLLPSFKEFDTISNGVYTLDTAIVFNKMGNAMVIVQNIKIGDTKVNGEMVLVQGSSLLLGLRSSFGLAPIPTGQYYKLGGVANLSILLPTAGREALSRESIDHVNRMIIIIEKNISEKISLYDIADNNIQFMSYIINHNRIELAANVTVQVEPQSEKVALGKLKQLFIDKKMYYYTGNNQAIIQMFGTGETNLIVLSQSNPRRQLQMAYISNIGIPEVPDKAQAIKTFERSELRMEEIAFVLRLTSILNEDYLVNDVEFKLANISHGVSILVEHENGLVIYLDRNSSIISPVLECYKAAYEAFGGFVKDFIRVHLYPRIANYVPSSTREGADALQKIIKRNRELFSYESTDLGKLEALMGDYITGDLELTDMLKASKIFINSQSLTVEKEQIGQVENEIPDIVNTPVQSIYIHESSDQEYPPMPAISREETETSMKVLTVDKDYPHLNNFRMFLALSDRVFKTELDFFLGPHATKVIWASHRIIYIFTHASYSFTLYYDIELNEPLKDTPAGGCTFPTTTIITKNKIFIPVPLPLAPSFEVSEGTKQFYVRFDTLC